mgnify:FL=1
MDCIVLGGLVADRYFDIESFPERGQDGLITSETAYVGGCAINIAATINNLGGNAHIVSYVGNDKTGEQIMNYIRKNKFAEDFIKQTEGISGYCLVFKEPDGERTFLTKKGVEGNFDTGLLDNIDNIRAKVGAVTGYYLLNENASLIMDCIEVMRVSGTKFIFDPGPLVGSIDKEILKRMVKASAVITPNEAELAVFEQEDKNFIENFIKNKGIVVRKQGNRGGMCYTRHGIFNYNSVKTEAVDTTGAGDSFTGALCYSLGSGTDIKSSVELASVCAAKTVEINAPHGFWKIKED